MLDYIKYILDKVSFDPHLFEKELRKNTRDLIKEDIQELKRWCYENFSNKHDQILNNFFFE